MTPMRWLTIGVAVFANLCGLHGLGFRVNTTQSVPVGLYRIEPIRSTALRRDQFVCLPIRSAVGMGRRFAELPKPPRDWSERLVLLKRVSGLGGDTVSIERDAHGKAWATLAAEGSHTRLGPVDASWDYAISESHYPVALETSDVWLSSDHERGFDSRFYGPVPLWALTCRARPIWTL